MQTSYIYSASRTNTLSEDLLTKADIDRLLVASAGEELHTALKETYLAQYLIQAEENPVLATEHTMLDAKELITRVIPKSDMFKVLWIQHDIHNLRVFAKAAGKELSYEACVPHTSKLGVYDPAYLYEHVNGGTLNRLEQGWQEAYDEAVRLSTSGELNKVDEIFDRLFFATAARIVQSAGDVFIKKYFKAIIDLHNLKSRLRVLTHSTLSAEAAFIEGGNFAASEIDTKEQILAAYQKLGDESSWRDAVEYYETTNNTTRLDARAEDYLLSLTREAAYDMFSSASLVLYYLRCRQSSANVRTIVVGIDGGMKEEDIRANLRMAYVN